MNTTQPTEVKKQSTTMTSKEWSQTIDRGIDIAVDRGLVFQLCVLFLKKYLGG